MLREPDPHFRLLDRALAGRYVLERRLGRGGMGVVFLARELRLERRVAIKLLLPAKAVDPVARERFLVEARTAAQLTHPNIVPIFAVDELSDVVFFAMAYIEGQTLGQRVRERGPRPPASVAPGVPRRLARIIDRCLLKEPAARFTSGAHLADAVRLAVAVPVGPPIALRAFLVESRHLSAPALVYGALLGLAVPLLVMQLVTSADLGPRLVAAGFIIWLFALPSVLMLVRVRRLCAAGFDRDDLTDALSAELARHREELAFLYGDGPSRLERLLRRLAYAGVCI